MGRCSFPQQLHAGPTPPHPRPVASCSVDQQRRRPRHNHPATSDSCVASLLSCQSDRRGPPHGPATSPAHETGQGPHRRPTSHIHMYQRLHTDGLALAATVSYQYVSDTAQQQPSSHRPPRTTRQGRAPPSPLSSTKAQVTINFSSRLRTRPASRPTASQWHPAQRSSKLQHTFKCRFPDCRQRSSTQSSSGTTQQSHIPEQTTME